jgi:exonuclease III
MNKLILILTILTYNFSFAQNNRILVDEEYSDWETISPSYTDISNDQVSGIIDFEKLWISNDDHYLFLRIEVGGEINLQNDNSITLYIDTDNNISSGLLFSGVGADLEFSFGQRNGVVRLSGNNYSITHIDIGLVTAPTVTSTQFEIAIKLDAKINDQELFQGNTYKVVLKDNGNGDDQLPDEDNGVNYTLTDFNKSPLPSYSITKVNPDYIRFLSYNVLFDNLFKPELKGNYSRVLQSVNPEIIAFQEIYNHSSQQTANLVESILPLEGDDKWYNSSVSDLVILSKFPIKSTFMIEGYTVNGSTGGRANQAVLIDLRPKYNSDMLVVNAHLPCCANNANREEEIDKILAFVRDAKSGLAELTLQPNTPIMIAGDMNLVGYSSQQKAFLTGKIFDNTSFGEDFRPDWDNTDLADLTPYTTDLPLVYTWYDENNSYSPGRLDYVFYTSSVLDKMNTYVLFTPSMHPDTLIKYSLEKDDVVLASDHLPVVADFAITNVTDIKNMGSNVPREFSLSQNYPNPFNPTTTIEYQIPESTVMLNSFQHLNNSETPKQVRGDIINVKLVVYDILGREVITLVNQKQKPGNYKISFDGSNLVSGIYYYQLVINQIVETNKMTLLK